MADDPVRADVLDHAGVELPLVRCVLGDVGQPDSVRRRSGELPPHQVVVDCRSGAFARVLTAPLRGRRPGPVFRAEPPDPSLTHRVAAPFELVGDEPISELGVVVVHVTDDIHEVVIVELHQAVEGLMSAFSCLPDRQLERVSGSSSEMYNTARTTFAADYIWVARTPLSLG